MAVTSDAAREHRELVGQRVALVEDWGWKIEHYLEETLEGQKEESVDPGPRTELDFWRTPSGLLTIVWMNLLVPTALVAAADFPDLSPSIILLTTPSSIPSIRGRLPCLLPPFPPPLPPPFPYPFHFPPLPPL